MFSQPHAFSTVLNIEYSMSELLLIGAQFSI